MLNTMICKRLLTSCMQIVYLGGNSAWDMTDQLEYGWDNGAGVKFWTAKAGVAVQKNVELDAYYNFGAKTYDSQAENPANTWGVELNYAF